MPKVRQRRGKALPRSRFCMRRWRAAVIASCTRYGLEGRIFLGSSGGCLRAGHVVSGIESAIRVLSQPTQSCTEGSSAFCLFDTFFEAVILSQIRSGLSGIPTPRSRLWMGAVAQEDSAWNSTSPCSLFVRR